MMSVLLSILLIITLIPNLASFASTFDACTHQHTEECGEEGQYCEHQHESSCVSKLDCCRDTKSCYEKDCNKELPNQSVMKNAPGKCCSEQKYHELDSPERKCNKAYCEDSNCKLNNCINDENKNITSKFSTMNSDEDVIISPGRFINLSAPQFDQDIKEGWTYSNGVIYIQAGASVFIEGNVTNGARRIVIQGNNDIITNVMFSTNVTMSGYSSNNSEAATRSPITIESGWVNINILEGVTVSLTSAQTSFPGIRVNDGILHMESSGAGGTLDGNGRPAIGLYNQASFSLYSGTIVSKEMNNLGNFTSVIHHQGDTLSILGGKIISGDSNGPAIAIQRVNATPKSINISGGTIQSVDHAISIASDAQVIIAGGTISSVNGSAFNVPSASANVQIIHQGGFLDTTSNFTINPSSHSIALTLQLMGQTSFQRYTSTFISSFPISNAFWDVEDGVHGIRWSRSIFGGFIPIQGIEVVDCLHVWGDWMDGLGGNCIRTCTICALTESMIHQGHTDDCTVCARCRAVFREDITRLPVTNEGGSAAVTFAGNPFYLDQIEGLFSIDASAGTRTFQIIDTDPRQTGEGTIVNNQLSITKAGTFVIGLTTEKTVTHNAHEEVISVLLIHRGDGAIVSDIPRVNGLPTAHSIAVLPINSQPNGQVVEYAISTTPDTNGMLRMWSNSPVFDGLEEFTTYYVLARSAANELFHAGEIRHSVSIRTADVTPPTGEIRITPDVFWHSFLETITFGLIRFNSPHSVTITATDNSGEDVRIYWYKSVNDYSLTELTDTIQHSISWNTSSSFSFFDPETFIIYVRLIDSSGNTSFLRSNGIIFCFNPECVSIESNGHIKAECEMHWQCSPNFNPEDHMICPHPDCDQRLCNGNAHTSYTVTFQLYDGGLLGVIQDVHYGHTLEKPEFPLYHPCASVVSWYQDAGFEQEWTFGVIGHVVTQDITLIARVEYNHTLNECIDPATCTVNGSFSKSCGYCDFKNSGTIPALGHNMVVTQYIPATCTTSGIRITECTRCDHRVVGQLNSLGHSAPVGNWIITLEPSCFSSGERVELCSRDNCNMILAQEEIPAQGCIKGDWVIIQEPSITSQGEEELRCIISNTLIDTRFIPPIGTGDSTGNGAGSGNDENASIGSGIGQGGAGTGQGAGTGTGSGTGTDNNGTTGTGDTETDDDTQYATSVINQESYNESPAEQSDSTTDDIDGQDESTEENEESRLDDPDLPLMQGDTNQLSVINLWILVMIGILIPTGIMFFLIKYKKDEEQDDM